MSFHVFSQAVARRRADFLSPAPFATGKDRGAKLAGLVLRYRSWFIALFQALLIFCALILAWLLRFNFFLPDRLLLFSAAPVLIAIRLGAISRFGLLHGWWRYTDIDDAVAIFKAIASGSAVFVFCMRFVLGSGAFPRTVYVLEPLLSMLFLGGVRVLSRILAESVRKGATPGREVILIGAGSAAQMTIREIGRPGSGYRAVACVDDDRSKTGIKIHGVPVIGTVEELRTFAASHAIHEVLIAVPSATGKQMQRFVDICGEADMKFKTVPSVQDILNGRINVSQFRDVRVEDLLGREPVEIDLESVQRQIEGQIVLVTGAAGSIGSELCRQILQSRPGKLICIGLNYRMHALESGMAIPTIPVVFTAASDPVRAGLVASLAQPGGNLTGLVTFTSVVETKKFGLLREMVPKARNIAMLINPAFPPAEPDSREVESLARTLRQKLFVVRASDEHELDIAFATAVKEKAGALLVAGDPFFNSQRNRLVALASRGCAQAVHHVFVVHHLMAHVDWRAEQVDGALDDVDGSIDAGAEPTRIGEKNLHQCFRLESNSASSRSSAAPTVIAESATLNAGKYARFQ